MPGEKKLSITWILVSTALTGFCNMLIFIHQDNLEMIYLDVKSPQKHFINVTITTFLTKYQVSIMTRR